MTKRLTILDQVIQSYGRNCGDFDKMKQELDMPDDELRARIKSLKESLAGDRARETIERILTISIQGHTDREEELDRLIKHSAKNLEGSISECCHRRTTSEVVKAKLRFYCTACKKETFLVGKRDLEALKIHLQLLESKRAEAEQFQNLFFSLASLIEKAEMRKVLAAIGFVPKERVIEAGLSDGETIKRFKLGDVDVLEDINKLPMFERKRLVDKLEGRILAALKAREARKAEQSMENEKGTS
jgi:hypothetical protein